MVGTMQRYVAFLRGIAPSGTNMTNDKLRGVFEELGFAAVGSVLASGNITFRASEADVPFLEQTIEEALVSGLGVTSRTIIRECSELRGLVDSDPFPGLTHQRRTYLTATFVKDASTVPDVLPGEAGRRTRVVRYDRVARAVLAVTDTSDPGEASGFMSWLEKTCGKDITTRSWLTVQRVVAKLES
ncbi:DUF1697 domain-containing protein [Pedococcus sp.]|jgi:uncharacterized protein (DUF1697 family)|uniref:DUF1697 domain-containing protein n=1 Tax=Pedococcus sp. TaxID=2860345 RepID=UPI002F93258D